MNSREIRRALAEVWMVGSLLTGVAVIVAVAATLVLEAAGLMA